MSESTAIRLAAEDDAEPLIKIYAPYIINNAVTFKVPAITEFKERMDGI